MKKKKIDKPTQGGKRANAGRRQKFGEKTDTIAFRVPISRKEEIKQKIASLLNTADHVVDPLINQ